jgi:predicted MFS family arabinose efflux permease
VVQPNAVATRRPQHLHTIRAQLAVLTAAKTVANTAMRWVGPFLPTLERAFGTTTGTLTGIIGVAELAGLSTAATGPKLDRGHERTVFTLGLLAVAVSSAIALGGSVWTFAVSFVVLVLGVGNLTIAGHAWIGHRVAFHARNRAIGSFETSWAVALLVGAPLLALLIRWYGWRGPYVALLVGATVAAVVVWLFVAPGTVVQRGGTRDPRQRLPVTAWAPILASAATAATGIGVFIVSGVWLDDAHGVSTAGLGLVAAGFGAVELLSSSGVALFADRFGVRRSVIGGLSVLGCGLATMALSGASTALAVAGLALFLTGFEYAFVASLTMVTEAAPEARGRTIGISNMVGTLARSGAVVASGQLYEAFGMTGPMLMSATTAILAATAAAFTRLSPG